MQGSLTPLSVLGPQADDERQRIRKQFEAGVSAQETVLALCELADNECPADFWRSSARSQHSFRRDCAWWHSADMDAALLFPYSDLDILFLFGNEKAEQNFPAARLRTFLARSGTSVFASAPPAARSRNANASKKITSKFHLALLDRSFLAGDEELFDRLNTKILPGPPKNRRVHSCLRSYTKLTKDRHGALRQHHFSPGAKRERCSREDCATIRRRCGCGRSPTERKMAGRTAPAKRNWPPAPSIFSAPFAVSCITATSRNDNTLTYELQAAAAERSLGLRTAYGAKRRGMDASVFSPCAHSQSLVAPLSRTKALGAANTAATIVQRARGPRSDERQALRCARWPV